MKTVEIWIELLDEGTDTIRGTQAVDLGNGLYRILATPDYDPEDEIWKFLPGAIVRCKEAYDEDEHEDLLLAVEQVS